MLLCCVAVLAKQEWVLGPAARLGAIAGTRAWVTAGKMAFLGSHMVLYLIEAYEEKW